MANVLLSNAHPLCKKLSENITLNILLRFPVVYHNKLRILIFFWPGYGHSRIR